MTHPSPVNVSYADGNVIHGADINAYGTAINQLGTLTNPLPVSAGGTGIVTATGLLVGSGTNPMTTVAAPASAVVGISDTQTLTNKTIYLATASTATTGGTVTLVYTSSAIQVWTGTLTETIILPTTSVPIGAQFWFVNQSSGALTVQSSNTNTITTVPAGVTTLFTAGKATPVVNTDWGFSTGLTVAYGTTATATTLAERDANVNLFTNNNFENTTSQNTSTLPITLTITSSAVQVFTGSASGTLTLPTTSVPLGAEYYVINTSTGTVTVTASAGATVTALAPNTSALFSALAVSPTLATQWDAAYDADNVASGKVVTINNSLTFAGTDATTMTFPTTSATIARTDAANTFTGVQTMTSPAITTPAFTGTATGTYTLGSTPTLTSPAINTPTTTGEVFAAGTATVAPLTLTSGTNLTTAAAGALEYDGKVPYFSTAASTRSVLVNEQFCTLTSAYSGTVSQTAAQKLFNSSTNGAVTLPIGTYFFECFFSLSSMSASSGTFGWALVPGTATISGQLWESEASMTALATAVTPYVTVNTAANVALTAVNTTALGWAKITGKCRVSVAGTVTPSFSLGVAAAPVVGVDSYFRIWQDGLNTVQTVGNWS